MQTELVLSSARTRFPRPRPRPRPAPGPLASALPPRLAALVRAACLVVLLLPSQGAPVPALAQSPVGPSAAPASSPTLETLAPGVYRLGRVTLDKNTRQVRFPATVNQTAGPVEYLLVGSAGKVHESVLRTDATPTEVHTALLLLGLKIPAGKGAAAAAPPAAIDADYLAATPLPPGVPVTLLVRWTPADDPAPVDRRAESLVDNARTKAPMAEGDWLYNGSLIVAGRFQAEQEKSFVAVVTDPAALVNNPRPGHDDEALWTAGTDRLPKTGTPVEFIIQLPAANP